VQNWVPVAEVDKLADKAVAFPRVPWPGTHKWSPLFSLKVVATLATIIPQVSSRQDLSHVS
jgi:hypothetical protein